MHSSDDSNNHAPRHHGLHFFGVITASVTHELNNVMSIIEQMAGLLDDLCAGAEYGKPIENEKLLEISGKVGRQVDRGVDIIKRLNFFAHSVDEPVKTFELETLLRNLVDLAQRFASLKNLRLEGHFDDDELIIKTSPFVLEQAAFVCIQLAINAAEANDVVVVASNKVESGALVSVSGSPALANEVKGEQQRLVETLIQSIRGSVEVTVEGDQGIVKLTVPNISDEAHDA